MGRRNSFAAAFKNDFACGPCGYFTGSTTAIQKHMTSKRHLAVLAARASAAEVKAHEFACGTVAGLPCNCSVTIEADREVA